MNWRAHKASDKEDMKKINCDIVSLRVEEVTDKEELEESLCAAVEKIYFKSVRWGKKFTDKEKNKESLF